MNCSVLLMFDTADTYKLYVLPSSYQPVLITCGRNKRYNSNYYYFTSNVAINNSLRTH